MTKPPQQTIGNTVYRVGQRVTARWLLEMPEGVEVKRLADPVECLLKDHEFDLLCFEITALPNPDVVADEWRELGSHRSYKIKEAMANPYIRIDWPEWSAAYRKYGAYTELDKQTESRSDYCYECEKFLIRAVALGGKVSVKGGV